MFWNRNNQNYVHRTIVSPVRVLELYVFSCGDCEKRITQTLLYIVVEFSIDEFSSLQLLERPLMNIVCNEICDGKLITIVDCGKSDKYLQFQQLAGIRLFDIKMELRNKFLISMKCVLKTFHDAGNKVHEKRSMLINSFGKLRIKGWVLGIADTSILYR